MKEFFALLGVSICCCGCFLLLNLAFPLYFLITGIVQIDGCPSDSRLPLWMIIFGSFVFLERTVNQVFSVMYPRDERGESKKPAMAHGVSFVFSIAGIALSLIALIWCSKMLQNDPVDCNGFVFWPSFIFSILAVVGIALSIMCLACVCCGLVAAKGAQFTRLSTV